MTIASDIANDDLHFTNTVTVTVETDRTPAATTQDEVSTATQTSLRRARQIFGEVSASPDVRTWVIADRLLVNASDIQPGDVIVEAAIADIVAGSTRWQVNEVARERMDTQWICLCVKRPT